MLAGMDYAEGDALVIMDADLQDPPELLPDMITWWEKGYRDVSARRRHREGETFFKKWSSHVYYRLLKKLSPVPVQEDVGDFRLLDKRCVKALCSCANVSATRKASSAGLALRRKKSSSTGRPGPRARPSGTIGNSSTWPSTALPASRRRPCASPPSPAASSPSSPPSTSSSLSWRTLLYGEDVPGYPSLISLILFIGGVQFTFMGILGEYVGRIYNESKGRPPYIVGESTKRKKIDSS